MSKVYRMLIHDETAAALTGRDKRASADLMTAAALWKLDWVRNAHRNGCDSPDNVGVERVSHLA